MVESPVQNKGFYLPKITQNGNKKWNKNQQSTAEQYSEQN